MDALRRPRRQAVIDLGSNSFRLVVFSWLPGNGRSGWWKRTDEIYEAVRIGEGLEESGALQPEPVERALQTLELYAHYCESTHIDDVRAVATSAIRDAANQADFLRAAGERSGFEVEVLSTAEEARHGYLAAVNTTALADGVALDLGGGSMQLTRVEGRLARASGSWPLGAVRMTERFLPDKRASKKQLKALRAHVREELERDAPWLAATGERGGRLAGIGGTVRNLAAAAQQGLRPGADEGVHREGLDQPRLAAIPAALRRGRGDHLRGIRRLGRYQREGHEEAQRRLPGRRDLPGCDRRRHARHREGQQRRERDRRPARILGGVPALLQQEVRQGGLGRRLQPCGPGCGGRLGRSGIVLGKAARREWHGGPAGLVRRSRRNGGPPPMFRNGGRNNLHQRPSASARKPRPAGNGRAFPLFCCG